MKYISFDIVFQEVPGEVTLAVNISNCPNRCKGCHSPHLQEDAGETLDENTLSVWLGKYGNAITCICFMGGDAEPLEVCRLAGFVKRQAGGNIKTGWYSGKNALPEGISLTDFDYIKLGAYTERLGGLDKPTTNQRFYRIEKGKMIDKTNQFVIK
ncbi:MAG: anaerobic ribonucleoside-triphosphate reductase activating protein [Dysgonamonadaceae bacterium]|jgi:anaerobic ribonucleoside-triphosphate reductase activating protein|nr:anaerobic ribonucleoside-triphosphate reductase activating protein [Dysgonamonadaceae bacterium]